MLLPAAATRHRSDYYFNSSPSTKKRSRYHDLSADQKTMVARSRPSTRRPDLRGEPRTSASTSVTDEPVLPPPPKALRSKRTRIPSTSDTQRLNKRLKTDKTDALPNSSSLCGADAWKTTPIQNLSALPSLYCYHHTSPMPRPLPSQITQTNHEKSQHQPHTPETCHHKSNGARNTATTGGEAQVAIQRWRVKVKERAGNVLQQLRADAQSRTTKARSVYCLVAYAHY